MFRYYQTSEKGAWHPLPVKQAETAEQEALARGARKLTILTTNQMVADGDDEGVTRNRDDISYKGPLYFDIDCKEDLSLAIESGVRLSDRLIQLGVPEAVLQIFASGSKGIHLLVAQSLFSSGRFTRRLPEIYKEMARELYVPGVDFAVYCGGRGNSFRMVNQQRADGNYRVSLLPAELRALTAETYREIVKAPRTHLPADPGALKIPELIALYDEAKKRVNAKERVLHVVGADDLAKIKDEAPTCVQQLVDWNDIRAEANYNQVATQVASYIVRSGHPHSDALMDRLAQHGKSSSYNDVRSRRQHMQGQVNYVAHNPKFQFSCNAIRGLLGRRPCEGCPLEKAHQEGADGDLSCAVRGEGYFVKQAEGNRRLTNFTLKPTDTFMEIPQDGTSARRVGTKITVLQEGLAVASIVADESVFIGRGAFLKCIEGLHDLVFQGSDNDVQRIKKVVFQQGDDELGEMYRVYSAGIHVGESSGQEILTYVEPGMSINSVRVKDTHQFGGVLQAPPAFGLCNAVVAKDKQTEAILGSLLRINKPLEVGLIVGWFIAAHYKAHMDHLYSEFPLLSLWGNAGSGKSKTGELVSWICGTDYGRRDSPANLANISPFALIDHVSSTTTVPRLLEEFNKSKMGMKNYKQVGEMLKSAWGGETVLRGTIAKGPSRGRTGAMSVPFKISAPLVIMSEQEPEMPALQERTIRVQMSRSKRAGCTDNFMRAMRGKESLRSVGKALMIDALTTPMSQVSEEMDKLDRMLPEDLYDRPRRSLQITLFALHRFRKLVKSWGFSSVLPALDECISAVEEDGRLMAGETTVQSEVDLVVSDLALIIAVSESADKNGQGNIWLRQGIHYITTAQYLVIDPVIAHACYVSYVGREKRHQPVIDSSSQFMKLIREEPYFDRMEPYADMGNGRHMMFLNLKKMQNKRIDITLLTMEEIADVG